MSSRRSFFKFITGGLAAGVSSVAMGVDMASGKDKTVTALNFTCICNENLIARVPEKEGALVEITCNCGRHWTLEWKGNHFSTICGYEVKPPLGINRPEFSDTLEGLKKERDRFRSQFYQRIDRG